MKILYFLNALNIGGAETFIYNTLKVINTKKYHIDFVLQSRENQNKKLISLCEEKESNFYYIVPFYKNYLKSVVELKRILINGKYDIIHVHANALINMVPIIAVTNVETQLVLHSHNTRNNFGGIIGRCLHKFNRRFLKKSEIFRIACGEEAGKWMYGKQQFMVLNNAIDLDEYKYNISSRNEIRRKLNLNNNFVIGNISRFVAAKNHAFILEVFREILNLYPDSKLVLLGEGELMEDIKKKSSSLKIQENIIFVGNVQDTRKYYSAFDCLLFPSFFEGLPFTLIEAQASGLPVVTSDAVTREVAVTDLLKFVSLKDNIKSWVSEVNNALVSDRDRSIYRDIMKNCKYDIKKVISDLEKLYDCCIS